MPIMNTVIAGGGTTPTGTISITSNGTHDVTNYANADVQVPTSGPTYYIEKFDDGNGKLLAGSNILNLTGITDVGDYALEHAYSSNPTITGTVNLSNITQISGTRACYEMFSQCPGVTGANLSGLRTIKNTASNCCGGMFNTCQYLLSFDLSSLEEIRGPSSCSSMFAYCYALTNANLSSLKQIITYSSACDAMFKGCSALVSADLSSLELVNGDCNNMFYGCSVLVSVNFSSLNKIQYSGAFANMFRNCSALTNLYFPAVDNSSFVDSVVFSNMCRSIPNITLHFPSNTQSTVEGLSGYSTTKPFGATAGTVLFDLPATVTLTGADTNTYQRNPKYDTSGALGWFNTTVGRATPYYTSGTTDPSVSDTIYSDSACTTPITTISSIA